MRVLAILVVTACQRDPAVVMCMNANCVTPIDVDRDNTMSALAESLQLQWQGRPAFDGIEIDTVWDADGSRCLFTYLFDTAGEAADAREAANAIAAHVRAAPADTRFYFKVQGKFRVAPSGRDPTRAELEAHTDCDLELVELVEAAAREVGRPMTTLLGEEPAQIAVMIERPRFAPADAWSTRKLCFKVHEVPPNGARADVIAIEATGIHSNDFGTASELEGRGIAVELWSRYLTPAAIDAIEAIGPTIVDTNDVLAARLLLGPTPEGP